MKGTGDMIARKKAPAAAISTAAAKKHVAMKKPAVMNKPAAMKKLKPASAPAAIEAIPDGPELIVENQGHVRILTINRAHRMNSLTPTLIHTLSHEFNEAGIDPEVRAVVLTGTGERAFCAGLDLKLRREADAAGQANRYFMHEVSRFFLEVIQECAKPTIAALNGAAVAGGFEMAVACDIRIGAEHVMMGLPEAKRAMGAHFSTIMLPRVIPRAIAMEVLFRGDLYPIQEGYRWGFINRVVPRGQALASALEMAQAIARNAPVTVRRMKETAMKSSGMPLAAAMRLNEGQNPYLAEDRVEGIRAYVEKREPKWKNR